MSKLQQHYINFQSQPTIPHKILYLQKHQNELSQFNINVPNLIKSYTTNQWPWNQPRTENF